MDLLQLYASGILGDGHGMVHPVQASSTEQGTLESASNEESRVQRKKHQNSQREQVRQLADSIRHFRTLGQCDHD